MKVDVKYTMDKGVPVPVRKVSLPIRAMEVGDSFAFNINDRDTAQSRASILKRKMGREYTISKISDTECRIWRTK